MQLAGKGIQADINVTPLIDVVLVLLIIFMVVVPLLEQRFVIAVPEADVPKTEQDEQDSTRPLMVFLEADGQLKLNDEVLGVDALVDKLRRVLRRRQEKVVFFDAALGANYGVAVDVMDACRGAGARHIGVVDPEAMNGELPPVPTP